MVGWEYHCLRWNTESLQSLQSVEKLKPPLQTVPITLASDCGASLKLHGCINPLPSNPATCWGLGYSLLPHNMAAWCAGHTQTSIRERLPCAAAGWLSSWLQKRQRVKIWEEEMTSVGNLIPPSYPQSTPTPPNTTTTTTSTLSLFSKSSQVFIFKVTFQLFVFSQILPNQ